MAENDEIQEEFQWTFTVNEVVKFEETSITVYSKTYEQAIRKIKKLKLPSLKSLDDIEENLKLASVYEVDPLYDGNINNTVVSEDE